MSRSPFISFYYSFDEVCPSPDELSSFLQLDKLDEGHPALEFIDLILPELLAIKKITGGFSIFDVEELNVKAGQIKLGGATLQLERQVAGYLKGSVSAALFLCTAGEEFTRLSDHYTARGDLMEAYLVDAIGSLTAEKAMDRVMHELETMQHHRSMHISNRYSPGYCHWPLTDQQTLFQLVGTHNTGITLTPSSLMIPRKSVSGIIGIGPHLQQQPYGCSTCNSRDCIYRRIIQS